MSKPSDFQQREQALDIEQSWIVQAPAGSGKTGILVYRMLKLLTVAKRPEEILAITFTKKAAKEMRDRLLELLQAADKNKNTEDLFEQQGLNLAKMVLANDQQHGWQLLDMPHRLNIETIDALCARLVASMPWLSRLGDKPNTTDKADVHFQYAVEQLLLELVDESSDIFPMLKELLLSLDNNFHQARVLLKPMLGRRDQWLRHFLGKDIQRSRTEFEDTWRTISEDILIRLADSVPVGAKDKIIELAYFGAENRVYEEMQKSPRDRNPKKLDFLSKIFLDDKRFPRADFSDIDLWLGVRDFLITSTGTIRSPRGITKTIGFLPKTPEKERFINLLNDLENSPQFIEKLIQLDNIPPAKFTNEQWQKILVLEQVLRRLLSHLQLRFHNTKECDFGEVSLRANQALQDLGQPTDLALRMDYQIQHILVDEFQDTSHSQFTLLENLTKGWQYGDGRSLFLVGDPMQSIYRFREADVGLFVKLAEGRGSINDIQLNSLVLTENFRSNKALVDWFNDVFADSFPNENNESNGAIKYSLSSSHKAQGDRPKFSAFHDQLAEAEHIVMLVKQALIRGDEKIAILVRSRPQLAPILPALQAAKISFTGVDINPLETTQEILDIVSLCKTIIRLDNKVAWLSVLRGPFVGLSLSDITLLTEGKDAIVWERLKNSQRIAKLSEDGKQRVSKFCKIMQLTLQQKQHVPLAALVQWTWLQLGGEACLQNSDNINVDDLSVVWSLIRDLEEGGDIEKITDLEASLKGLYAQTNISSDNNEPLGICQSQVIVSTMHKSKGLQYDTVILPSLTRKGANQDKDILRWAEVIDATGQERLLLAALDNNKEKNTHYYYLQMLEKQREANEQLRLLYVACTRAETHLYLSGVFQHDKKTGALKARNIKNSLMQGIWETTKDEFSLEPQEDEMGILLDSAPDQTLYRLPDDFIFLCENNIDWQHPLRQQTKLSEKEISYEWASYTAQATGIVLHDWLENHGKDMLDFNINDMQKQRWRAEFQSMRLDSQQIESATKRMSIAIKNMQLDPRAKWIFTEPSHTQIHNEYAISAVDDDGIKHHRVDRTFIDKEGFRWIIDYKSTTHFESDVDEFIDQQIEERGYRAQLERYANAFKQLENREIKLGIYFPLLKQWREWVCE